MDESRKTTTVVDPLFVSLKSCGKPNQDTFILASLLFASLPKILW
jgi:hypothetical protein